MAKIADLEVPVDPRTTFCVSNFHAGNDAGVHAIAPKATIKFNLRSNSAEILEELNKRIFKAIQDACDEETARWGKDTHHMGQQAVLRRSCRQAGQKRAYR